MQQQDCLTGGVKQGAAHCVLLESAGSCKHSKDLEETNTDYQLPNGQKFHMFHGSKCALQC